MGTADRKKPMLMAAIQEEGRKKRKTPVSAQGRRESNAVMSQKNAVRLNSTLLS